jgi:AcrR family transcriptional regulator
MKSARAKSPWGATPRKRETQYPEKRDAVLRAAAKLFRENGYDGVSLNELAEVLKITKPTIYYYVKSKDDLISQIKWTAQDEVLAFTKAAEEREGMAYDKLREIMLKYALFMTTDYGVCLALVPPRSMDPKIRDEIYARVSQANQAIYRVLETGKKDGSLAFDDPVIANHALFGSLNWIGFWFEARGRLSAQQVVEQQVSLLLDGVRGPKAPA